MKKYFNFLADNLATAEGSRLVLILLKSEETKRGLGDGRLRWIFCRFPILPFLLLSFFSIFADFPFSAGEKLVCLPSFRRSK